MAAGSEGRCGSGRGKVWEERLLMWFGSSWSGGVRGTERAKGKTAWLVKGNSA